MADSISLGLTAALATALIFGWMGNNRGQKNYNFRSWQSNVNETITRRSYFNQTVAIDGKTFDHCTFKNVRFMYHGLANTTFIDSQFSGDIYLQSDNAAVKGFAILEGFFSRLPGHNTVMIGDVDSSGNIHITETLHARGANSSLADPAPSQH